MAKFKIVYEHDLIGMCDFEYEADISLDRMREIVASCMHRNSERLIDVVEVES